MKHTQERPHPTLYEIDTRAWLDMLGRRVQAGAPLTLVEVPDEELDRLKELGFDWVWLLGVWTIGRAGGEVSRAQPGLVRHGRDLLPDYRVEDLAGSIFAVQAYEVAPAFGGAAGLRAIRNRLRDRGMRLMLDFVPNHTALDHPWVASRPDFYVQGSEDDLAREPQNYTRVSTARGSAVLAFGRDPYFSGWTDTLQLNYRHPGLRAAMADELARIAGLCDGLRCDMTMLLLPEIFLATWGDRALPADGKSPDDAPFWPYAIARARAVNPDLFLLAEVYWDLEWAIQRQGFDATYDKRLYDRLRALDAPEVRGHLHASIDFQGRCARFLENHDEDRAASTFPAEVHPAAAVITFLTPGLRFFHQGELEGRKLRASVHLARRPDDPTDPALIAFYGGLLAVLGRAEPHLGTWRLCDCREAWPGNPTWDRFIAFTWDGPGSARLLVAVNYGPTWGQCYVALPPLGSVRFHDLTGPAVYDRDALELETRGLYLDMPAWGYHVFSVEPR